MPMYVNGADVLSTLSPGWIAAMKRSERYRGLETWEDNPTISVPVVTLDSAIAGHGVPAFTKIDVEGYELQVLKGLNMRSDPYQLHVAIGKALGR
jgi:FkbM family methyltransferase